MDKRVLAVILLTVAILVCVGYALMVHLEIPNRAVVETLQVTAWQDENCTIPLNEIDWGVIDAGETKTFTAYLKIIGNKTAIIYSWADQWSPDGIQQYLTYGFDKNVTVIQPNVPLQVIFSLAVNESIPATYSNFTFVIHVVAEVRDILVGCW